MSVYRDFSLRSKWQTLDNFGVGGNPPTPESIKNITDNIKKIYQEKIMKKDYLKPELDVEVFSINNVILSTSNDNDNNMPVNPDEEEGGDFAGRNRGEWGNVWGK